MYTVRAVATAAGSGFGFRLVRITKNGRGMHALCRVFGDSFMNIHEQPWTIMGNHEHRERSCNVSWAFVSCHVDVHDTPSMKHVMKFDGDIS